MEQFAVYGVTSEAAVADAERRLGFAFPASFREWLLANNRGQGAIYNGDYLDIWMTEEIVQMNADYETAAYAPGFVLVGSNGGGEAIAVSRLRGDGNLYKIPFAGMRDTDASRYELDLEKVQRRTADRRLPRRHVIVVTPIVLGGSPADRANKQVVDQPTHVQHTQFWNRTIKQLRDDEGDCTP